MFLKPKIRFPKLTGQVSLTQTLSQLTVAQNPSWMPIIHKTRVPFLQLVPGRWASGASMRGARAAGNRAQCPCAALPPSARTLVPGKSDRRRGDAATLFARQSESDRLWSRANQTAVAATRRLRSLEAYRECMSSKRRFRQICARASNKEEQSIGQP